MLRVLPFLIFICAAGYCQQNVREVIIEGKEVTLKEWLDEIGEKGKISFTYSPQLVRLDEKKFIPRGRYPISDILKRLFENQEIDFIIRGDKVILTKQSQNQRNQTATISGYIKEKGSGESLIGATLLVKDKSRQNESLLGAVSNAYGFYSITLPVGEYTLLYSYIGYEPVNLEVDLQHSTIKNIELPVSTVQLKEIVVESDPDNDPKQHVYDPTLGKVNLDISEIIKMPALLGEVDVIKSIQAIPGVRVSGEGSTNFFVRGGNSDQNLILLDEAPVYNASHLMGFMSVFNPDAIKRVQFYRSGMSASYGGRLSSLLDIRMREGNQNKFQASGGLGLSSSRITLEGPIKKEKISFIVSARRTYADLFLKFSKDEFTRKSSVYFYDLNAKFNWTLGDRDKIYLSGYFGRDLNKFLTLQYAIDWGNSTSTLRWNHLFSDRLFSNTTFLYSTYDYLIDLSNENVNFNWNSRIEDYSFKSDFTYYANPNNQISFGLSSTYHQFEPGHREDSPNTGVPNTQALEHGLYISNELKVNDKVSLEYGIRYSLYQLIGPTTTISFDSNYLPILEESHSSGNIYKTYGGLEPRISSRYLINSSSSVKASYNRTRQYMQLLSNLSLGLNVFDIWFPSTEHTKPQTADLFSLGYFKSLKDNTYELSAETYFKTMVNQVDYRDHAQLIMNRYLEGELRYGKGRAYGLELMLKKKEGRMTGWLSYNYARSERKIKELSNNQYYPANFDQPNSISAGANYELSKRWSVGTNFTYATGRPITLPVESFRYENRIVPVYGGLNTKRLPDYHRLDVTFTIYPKDKGNRKNESYWTFGVYNAYNRHNAATAFVGAELEDINIVKAKDKSAYQKLYLFGILPSVTYNFNF